MNKYDVVIIGGSAAGVTAGITARRHYPNKSVLVIRAEEKVMIPCGIPYIYGTVGSPDKNIVPDAVLEKNKIDLVIDVAVDIDRDKRIVKTASGKEVEYDKLILTTGSKPIRPPIEGLDKKNVFEITKEVPNLSALLETVNSSKDLVIIGGGFIGVEFADECKKGRNINVTIVEMQPTCLSGAFDEYAGVAVEKILKERDINVITKDSVKALLGDEKVQTVKLGSGKEIKADTVILAIGAKANIDLAQKIGLEIGSTNSSQVDKHMLTSDKNIFACGDCAETLYFFSGKPAPLKLASIATMHARIAGANLFGLRRENQGSIGVYSTVVNETCFAAAGLTHAAAEKAGYEVVVGEATAPNRHPGGMPGMQEMTVHLICEKGTGKILGGQVYGAKSGGELINVISACISGNMTAEQVAVFQLGTHPALTASPIAYQLVNAAEMAAGKMRQ
ncbi:MAG: FAD-dependent oxidoreductase [Alphaproteobacteria bacterium]|nr:FAD-dependent oxidoreductase [Alphaproteobacteria bacterium]